MIITTVTCMLWYIWSFIKGVLFFQFEMYTPFPPNYLMSNRKLIELNEPIFTLYFVAYIWE